MSDFLKHADTCCQLKTKQVRDFISFVAFNAPWIKKAIKAAMRDYLTGVHCISSMHSFGDTRTMHKCEHRLTNTLFFC